MRFGNINNDEYDIIYNYDSEDSRNYEEFGTYDELDDAIEELKGCIGRGDCLYCDAKDAMEYEGYICFICKECGRSVHEDIYYRWAAGGSIEFED